MTAGFYPAPGEVTGVKHVRLELDAGGREAEIHPMYDLLANAAFVDGAKTTHWNVSGDHLGIMHYVHGDADRFRSRLDAIDDVEQYDLTRVDDGTFYAYLMCNLDGPAVQVFDALTRGRLVVNHPIEWTEDGSSLVSVVGTSAEIQAAIEDIPDPVSVTVHRIGGIEQAAEAAAGLLSDRQRAAVESALAQGYYAIPREASLADVADEMGCAESTAAEHLRKAEAAVLRSVFGGADGGASREAGAKKRG